MIELVYPLDPAPLAGPAAAASEMLPIVEVNGMVVGRSSREWCHCSEEKPLHPVVHLYVVDRFSRWYLQHRGPQVGTFPGKWDMAAGGHVGYGEMYEEALYREAGEELSLFDFTPQYLDNYLCDFEDQSELVNVYAAIGAFDPHPDNFEVQEGRWWTMEEIEASLGTGVLTPTFESEYKTYRERILAML